MENRTISFFGECVCRFIRFIRTSGKNGGRYVDGNRVLNVSGNCGQRLSFDPGKQNDGVVIDESHPAIGEPECTIRIVFMFMFDVLDNVNNAEHYLGSTMDSPL